MSDDAAHNSQNLPTSTPPRVNAQMQGFGDDALARRLGSAVFGIIIEIGRVIDLSTLDGITVAVDYDAALRDLDRGMVGLRPIERTNDNALAGVGRAVLVKRDGLFKTHLVFFAAPFLCLVLDEADPDDISLALGLIAHECAHVEEHAWREASFPGAHETRHFPDLRTAYVWQFSEALWAEYAVGRMSGRFAHAQVRQFRENLKARLDPAREAARTAIIAYRSHSDLTRVFEETAIALIEPLRMASYLFGHLDGVAQGDLPSVSSETRPGDAIVIAAIERMVEQLRSLWNRQDAWAEQSDMLVVGELAFELLHACGVDVRPAPDGGAMIDIPLTRDTLPDIPNAHFLFDHGLIQSK